MTPSCSHVAEAHKRIATQQHLQRQKHQLEQKNERLDRFTSILSHDLRNPLNVAQLRASLACQTGDTSHLEDVIEAHDRMEVMIEDLLTMARAKQTVEQMEEFPLKRQVQRAWNNCQTEESSLAIVASGNHTVTAEPKLLQHLFENLFRNAIEHNDHEVTVTVGTLGPTDYPHGFFVADDGRGIPEGETGQIFEHGYSTSEGGTGLGLSIVSEFVDAHDWDITARESEDGGARFEVYTVEK